MRVATIDIGTNSVLLLVAERGDDETNDAPLRPLLERATITRLGEGVDKNRRLLDAAAERTLTCLGEYARELRACGVTRLEAVGTSAMRDAEGGQAFVARAKEILGVAPRTIDGQEEARLTFAGALSGLPQTGKVAVFDIGGGSTEIIVGTRDALAPNERHIADSISLNIGSVRLFERHVRSDPPTREELALVSADITSALATAPRPEPGSTLVGVAGTVTQLAALELELRDYDSTRVHGRVMQRSVVTALADKLASLTLAERRVLPGMSPQRADVLVVGSAIARAVLEWSGATELVVSDRGVRWGLAEELAVQSEPIRS